MGANLQKLNEIVTNKCYYALTSSRSSIPKEDEITQIRNAEGLLLAVSKLVLICYLRELENILLFIYF